jgi:hypothetical protein
MANFRYYILFVILTITLFVSCEKAEEFSVIPEIKYKDFYLTPGSPGTTIATGNLVFSFIDGDGDIGNFHKDSTLIDHNADSLNMFIQGFYRSGGNFIPYNNTAINLPYLEKGIYRKTIKGEIEINLYLTILTPDTLMYSFYLVDRAGHQSNTETTPVLIISNLL